MFSLLSSSLSLAISRFITFEMGKGNPSRLKVVFCTSVNIQIALIVILVILLETIGLWLLNNKMVIPAERLTAANWVFQISVITFSINLLSVPYNASIIAHEKMSAFAYISIVEAFLKLIIAISLSHSPIDLLIFYALLMMLVSLIVRLIYGIYCRTRFEECSYSFIYDKRLLKEMFSFAGWNFFGNGSWLLITQGVNILLNIYFGVVVNAARGIANQVDNAVTQFASSFNTAINPQITKSYAGGDTTYTRELVLVGVKLSYFLLLFFSVPVIVESEYLLSIWLKEVPPYTSLFVRLTIITSMVQILSNSMITLLFATGDIKKYQITVGIVGCLVFPLSWGLFQLGLPPETAYFSTILIFLVLMFIRIALIRNIINISIGDFQRIVINKILFVTILSLILPVLCHHFLAAGLTRLIVVSAASVMTCLASIYFIGLTDNERDVAKKYMRKCKLRRDNGDGFSPKDGVML